MIAYLPEKTTFGTPGLACEVDIEWAAKSRVEWECRASVRYLMFGENTIIGTWEKCTNPEFLNNGLRLFIESEVAKHALGDALATVVWAHKLGVPVDKDIVKKASKTGEENGNN